MPDAIDKNEFVDGSAGVLGNVNGTSITSSNQAFGALLADEDFARGETFLEREERAGVLAIGTDDGEDGDVFVRNGFEKAPFSFEATRRRRRLRWFEGSPDKGQTAECADSQETADESGKNRAFHEILLCACR